MTAARWIEDPDHGAFDLLLPIPEPTLDDDGPDLTLADIHALTDRLDAPPEDDLDPNPDDTGWAIPGMPSDEGESDGGLSRTSQAALAEVTAAARAMRVEGARLYRAITALRESDAVTETGYKNLARLLEDHIRLDPAHVKRLAVHATALHPTTTASGTRVPAALPATAARVSDGEIGAEHVQVIERTITRLRALPADTALPDEVIDTTGEELATLAATRSPAALNRAATGILALLDADGTAPDDSTPPDNELHLRERHNGTLEGKFAYRDPAAAQQLIAASPPPPHPPKPPRWPTPTVAGRPAPTVNTARAPARTRCAPSPPAAPKPCSTSPPKPTPAASTSPTTTRTTTADATASATATPRSAASTTTRSTGTPRKATPPPTRPRLPATRLSIPRPTRNPTAQQPRNRRPTSRNRQPRRRMRHRRTQPRGRPRRCGPAPTTKAANGSRSPSPST
ncbi:DUF222 domain-containing protein, partial [Actinomycetospora atypica]